MLLNCILKITEVAYFGIYILSQWKKLMEPETDFKHNIKSRKGSQSATKNAKNTVPIVHCHVANHTKTIDFKQPQFIISHIRLAFCGLTRTQLDTWFFCRAYWEVLPLTIVR
jgi:hypothetical protein